MVTGQKTVVTQAEFLAAFSIQESTMTAIDVWKIVMDKLVKSGNTALEKWTPELSVILNEGTLSDRIIKAMGHDTSEESIKNTYRKLCGCLAQNKMFIP
jgi:carboxylate-amine ligase